MWQWQDRLRFRQAKAETSNSLSIVSQNNEFLNKLLKCIKIEVYWIILLLSGFKSNENSAYNSYVFQSKYYTWCSEFKDNLMLRRVWPIPKGHNYVITKFWSMNSKRRCAFTQPDFNYNTHLLTPTYVALFCSLCSLMS